MLTDESETVLPTLSVKLTPSDTIELELTRGDLIRAGRRAIRLLSSQGERHAKQEAAHDDLRGKVRWLIRARAA